VAFYYVERIRDPCGRVREQQFAAETYLVEHRFSPTDMSKVTDGTGVSPFKHALFHRLESGSYQYKRTKWSTRGGRTSGPLSSRL
jgi:hypothetical protein